MLVASSTWQRFALLAPVFVVGIGLVGAVGILLVRAAIDSWQESPHKRLMLIGFVALIGVVVLLTYLGIKIPKEE